MSGVSESHDDRALQPDPDLWMSDGNVVLSVKDAEGVTWGLRCHQSILARHSAVFATLFTLNQPSHSGQYDGVPLVILPDPYEEVKSLLQMLAYDPVKYIPDFEIPSLPPNDELDAIMGPLFLSHKYEITGLHSRLAKVLESLWPSTLAAWDKVSDRYRNEELVGELVDAAGLILLAEQTEVPNVLPAAYYHVNRWRRCLQRVQSISTQDLENHRSRYANILQQLKPYHHLKLAEGREYFHTLFFDLVWDQIYHKVVAECGCDGQRDCTAIDPVYQSFFGSHAKRSDFLFDPLSVLRDLQDTLIQPSKYSQLDSRPSPQCLGKTARGVQAFREFIWDELPYVFDLKPREEGKIYSFQRYLDAI